MNKNLIRLGSVCTCLALALSLAGCGASSSSSQAASGSSSDVEDHSDVYSAYLNDDGTLKGVDSSTLVTLPQYKGVTVPAEEYTITDDELNTQISSILDQYATYDQIKDRAIEDGDVVNIDYVGSVDGEEFSGGNTNGGGTLVTAGSDAYIDDFLTQIIGHTPGETFNVEVTFPDPYDNNPDLAGKPAQFKITLNSVSEEVVPELTDEFVAELGSDDHSHIDDDHKDSVKTVEDYRAYVREQLEKTYNEDVRDNQYLYTWTAIVNGCEVKSYPESAVKKYANDLYNYNYTWFASSGYSQYGLTAENFGITKEAMTEEARENLKEELCLWAVAKANNITVSDEEYTAKLNALVESTNKTLAAQYTADQYTPYTAETYLKTTTRQSVETKVLYDKIVGEAIATATFTEAE